MVDHRAILGHFAHSRAAARCASVREPTPFDPLMNESDLLPLLHRIAHALERLAPPGAAENDLDAAAAFVGPAEREGVEPVPHVNRVPLGLLRGIDRVRDI